VAWQHINYYGRYQLDEDFTPIDLNRLRRQRSSEEVSRRYATAERSCILSAVWAKNPKMDR
jgi:hypothetical protein